MESGSVEEMIVLQTVRPEETANQLLDKVSILLEVSKQFSLVQEPSSLAESMLTSVFHYFNIERAAIFLPQANGELVLKSTRFREGVASEHGFYSRSIVERVKNRQEGILTLNAMDDPDLPESESIIRQRIHACMCVPLEGKNTLLGVLYVDNLSLSHLYTKKDLQLLTGIAHQAALALLNMELQNYQLEMAEAHQLQLEFLPSQLPEIPGWDLAAYLKPARDMSGDLYDVLELPGNQIGLAIGDVCNKGAGAALFMALYRSLIRVYAELNLSYINASDSFSSSDIVAIESIHHNALKAIQQTNRYVTLNTRSFTFVTLFLGILDPQTGRLSYINSGHEALILVNPDGTISYIAKTSMAIGMFADVEFTIKHITLEPGSLLLGYTDGVTDARNLEGGQFKRDRLLSLLSESSCSATVLIEKIKSALEAFSNGAEQYDDITMLAIYRNPA